LIPINKRKISLMKKTSTRFKPKT